MIPAGLFPVANRGLKGSWSGTTHATYNSDKMVIYERNHLVSSTCVLVTKLENSRIRPTFKDIFSLSMQSGSLRQKIYLERESTLKLRRRLMNVPETIALRRLCMRNMGCLFQLEIVAKEADANVYQMLCKDSIDGNVSAQFWKTTQIVFETFNSCSAIHCVNERTRRKYYTSMARRARARLLMSAGLLPLQDYHILRSAQDTSGLTDTTNRTFSFWRNSSHVSQPTSLNPFVTQDPPSLRLREDMSESPLPG